MRPKEEMSLDAQFAAGNILFLIQTKRKKRLRMKNPRVRGWLFLIIIGMVLWLHYKSYVPTVTFCELISNPSQYNNKIVRIKATLFVNSETASLYDKTCNSTNVATWVEFDPSYKKDNKSSLELNNALCRKTPCSLGEANVTLIGRFHQANENGYGHLNDYDFLFEIIKVEEIEDEKSQRQ